MKNSLTVLLILFLTLATGILFTIPTLAQTPTSSETLILQLQQQIKALEEQVTKLQAEVSSTKTELETIKTELKFTKALRLGTRGDEVTQLQEFLKQFPDIYPQGLVTGYFGSLTETAVRKFQEKQGIESIGVVGPKTLSQLNKLVTEGAGASGVIPPGLLTAPGIQKKIEISTTTPSVGITVPTPTIPAPIQPATTVPTGVCLIKDRYTDIPRFDIANFGNGFAKYAVGGVNTVAGLQASCTQTIYNYLLQNYCKSNGNPIQRLIMTYGANGIGDASSFGCSTLGCSFIDCSSVASLASIPVPTTATTTTTTTVSTASTTTTTTIIIATTTPTTTTTATTTTATTAQPVTTATSATDTTPPVISAISVTSISNTCATIGWTANEPAGGEVEYSLTSAYGSTAKDPTLRTLNAMGMCLFNSGTTYHFRIKSTDGSGNVAISSDQTFTTTSTACSAYGSGVPSCLTATLTSSGTSVILQWLINGTVVETKVNRRVATESPFYRGSWSNIGSASQNSTSYTDSNVSPGSYEYYLNAYNTAGGSASSNFVTITVPAQSTATDTAPPVISNVRSENITTSSAQIKWTTDELADGIVGWSTNSFSSPGAYSTSTGVSCPQNAPYYVTDHCIDISAGLSAGTTYYYQVRSVDSSAAHNLSYSGVQQFTTTSVSSTATSTSFLNPRAKNLAAISQMVNSLNEILKQLSQLLK